MTVLTDQGQEWVSGLFKDLCKLMQIDKIQTAAYRPQTNSNAEVVTVGPKKIRTVASI